MRTTDHSWTEPREEAVAVDFERFARDWEAGADEREANRALCNSHFDAARDAALAKIWGEL